MVRPDKKTLNGDPEDSGSGGVTEMTDVLWGFESSSRPQLQPHAARLRNSENPQSVIRHRNIIVWSTDHACCGLIQKAAFLSVNVLFAMMDDPDQLHETEEKMTVKIKADRENRLLHITDTGVGMTRQDLINNLGTIARSGTSEFLSKIMDSATSSDKQQDLIGQFGAGFYAAFLIADRIVVTTKNNDDEQYIWESDSASFTISKDPRGNTLKRGTQITLYLKEEATDFLEPDMLKNLVHEYSHLINFDIFLWQSKTEMVEEAVEEEPAATEDGAVEEEKKEKKTMKVEKTTWDWEKVYSVKPIWMREPDQVEDDEYKQFYRSITKDTEEPLSHVHFSAEGEVSFRSILYLPKKSPNDMFQNYGKVVENIKLYVRHVFITDDFDDILPKYLSFIRGIVDSDDLPLNVFRDNLQQHKLLKVIKKTLVRKVLDMLKKLDGALFDDFWKQYSTNVELGMTEDPSNRSRLDELAEKAMARKALKHGAPEAAKENNSKQKM